MKLKTHEKCMDCQSCTPILGTDFYYCNMKQTQQSATKHNAILDIRVDPDSKPDDCPWDETSKVIDSFSIEDKFGLKCMAKMFSGGNTDFFEDAPEVLNNDQIDKAIEYLDWFFEEDEGTCDKLALKYWKQIKDTLTILKV